VCTTGTKKSTRKCPSPKQELVFGSMVDYCLISGTFSKNLFMNLEKIKVTVSDDVTYGGGACATKLPDWIENSTAQGPVAAGKKKS